MKIKKLNNLFELFQEQSAKNLKNDFLHSVNSDKSIDTLTWLEVNKKIKNFSKYLRKNKVKQGDRVMLVSEGRPEWMISDLAILANGAITVPNYTTYTEKDFEFILQDCEPIGLIVEIKNLIKSILKLAEKNKNVIMPGFTHLKNAQPVLFSHHLLAYIEMFKRDYYKFINVIDNSSENPLGSAALAGTSFNIDRNFTSKYLGFKKATSNSIDAVSDRDYALEFLFVSSLCSMHLSRLAEEIIIWNSDIVNMIKINDNMLTGSSIMPQKKNPDSAELLRGKTGSIFGNLNTLLVTMKGLPLSYFKDMQEDKKPVFESYHTLILNLKIAKELIENISPNKIKNSVASKKSYGGTSYKNVVKMLKKLKKEFK